MSPARISLSRSSPHETAVTFNGVFPYRRSLAFTSARCASNSLTSGRLARSAAEMSGVTPHSFPALTSAPLASSRSAAATSPFCAASTSWVFRSEDCAPAVMTLSEPASAQTR